jgi:pimeloyl-ACP methyl ester carboxylesterase
VSVARIETYFVPGPAGRLECFLKRPSVVAPGSTVAVICHPHPIFGGSMHNKVVHAAAEALAGLGMPVVRFNFRGVGRSAGRHDGGRGETDDLKVVLDDLAARFPGAPILAAGYSFGAWVALRVVRFPLPARLRPPAGAHPGRGRPPGADRPGPGLRGPASGRRRGPAGRRGGARVRRSPRGAGRSRRAGGPRTPPPAGSPRDVLMMVWYGVPQAASHRAALVTGIQRRRGA